MHQSSGRVVERKPTAVDAHYVGAVATARELWRITDERARMGTIRRDYESLGVLREVARGVDGGHATVDRMGLATPRASARKRAGVIGHFAAILSSRGSAVKGRPIGRVCGKLATRWARQLVAGTRLKQFDQPGRPGAPSDDARAGFVHSAERRGSTEYVTEAESHDHGIP